MTISAIVRDLDPSLWQNWPQDQPLPLQQHPDYATALKSFGASTYQITFEKEGQIVGFSLMTERKFIGPVRLTILMRGPVWAPWVTSEDQIAAFSSLKELYPKYRFNFLNIMPEASADDPAISGLNTAGFRRVMTGFSTLWLDIRADERSLCCRLHGKWRNQLRKAQSRNLIIKIGGKKESDYDWTLKQEAKQRAKRKYRAMPHKFISLYHKAGSAQNTISLIACRGAVPIAGCLFLKHGHSATYHTSWTSEEGRKCYAHNLLLWRAIQHLKSEDICFLDLGGLNTNQISGLARFKLGLAGLGIHQQPLTLAGAYM